MDTRSTGRVAYVEVTEEMKKREQALSNAVVASPLNPTTPKLLVTDIQLALHNKFGESAQPTKIENFPPDFILHFPTLDMQQTVLSYGSIEGPNFILRLSPWTNEYRCHKIPYNTLVTVEVEGIPSQAAVNQSLNTVLKPHCNIQTCDFDETTGICTAIAYAQSPATIPDTSILGLSYIDGTNLHSFPLNIRASHYTTPEKKTMPQGFPLNPNASHNVLPQKKSTTQWAQDISTGTENTDASNNYDPELDEDPDVVRETFEELFTKQKEDEEAWNTRHIPKNYSFHDYSSDSSFDPNDYEHADPDREPQCWKHGG